MNLLTLSKEHKFGLEKTLRNNELLTSPTHFPKCACSRYK